MTPFAAIGATALFLLYAWLGGAIIASELSRRKGYGERLGLASGLLVPVIGAVVWLFWPAKPDSVWRVRGPLGRGGKTVAQARAKAGSDAAPGKGE